MTKYEVIRQLAGQIKTADPLSEAMRLAIIDITVVEDARQPEPPEEPDPEEPKEPNEPNEPKEEPKEPKEPKKKKPAQKKPGKKPIDDGKIGALRKAGWSIAKIADEMRLSDQTVRNHLKKMGVE